jgi:hypothetical protein
MAMSAASLFMRTSRGRNRHDKHPHASYPSTFVGAPAAFHAGMPALHHLRVEAGLAQGLRGATGDVEAVDAEHRDGRVLAKLADPVGHVLRIPPLGAHHHFGAPRDGMARPRIDQLHGLARGHHRPQVFHRHARVVAELRLLEAAWARRVHRVLVALVDDLPVDIAQERLEVGLGVRAEVHVIGVLVHVEREDRHATGDRLRMLRCVLVDEPSVARHPGHEHPAGTARERLRHRLEFGDPAIVGAKVARDDPLHRLVDPAVAAPCSRSTARAAASS